MHTSQHVYEAHTYITADAARAEALSDAILASLLTRFAVPISFHWIGLLTLVLYSGPMYTKKSTSTRFTMRLVFLAFLARQLGFTTALPVCDSDPQPPSITLGQGAQPHGSKPPSTQRPPVQPPKSGAGNSAVHLNRHVATAATRNGHWWVAEAIAADSGARRKSDATAFPSHKWHRPRRCTHQEMRCGYPGWRCS